MAAPTLPRADLASQVLPAPLLRALHYVFEQGLGDTMLVGGTALSGYYAGHRRSDDLDLFCRTETDHQATRLAVKALEKLGASFGDEHHSRNFFHVDAMLDAHRFTIDVVLDSNLFAIGGYHEVQGLRIATFETLLMTKAATLVSRCSEKDLYDLIWLLEHSEINLVELVEMGKKVDGGMDAEAVLISLSGSTLTEQACHFADVPSDHVFAQISAFRQAIEKSLSEYLHAGRTPALGKLVRSLRRWGTEC